MVPYAKEPAILLRCAAAVVGERYDSRGRGHLFTEADWGEFGADESVVPYNRSKTLAERRAYEIAGTQERWTLATILPGVVQGPPSGEAPRHACRLHFAWSTCGSMLGS